MGIVPSFRYKKHKKCFLPVTRAPTPTSSIKVKRQKNYHSTLFSRLKSWNTNSHTNHYITYTWSNVTKLLAICTHSHIQSTELRLTWFSIRDMYATPKGCGNNFFIFLSILYKICLLSICLCFIIMKIIKIGNCVIHRCLRMPNTFPWHNWVPEPISNFWFTSRKMAYYPKLKKCQR